MNISANLKKTIVVFLLSFSVAIVLFLYIDYKKITEQGASFFENLNNVEVSSSVSTYNLNQEDFHLIFNATNDSFFSFPFKVKISNRKRLRVIFSQLDGVKYVSIFYRLEGNPGFPRDQTATQRVSGKNKLSYDFLLPPGRYTNLRIDFDGYRFDAEAAIKDIRLLEASYFFYTSSWFHLLTAFILCLLILPGTMLYALLASRSKVDSETNLLLFFSLSIAFYLFLYGVLETFHRIAADPRITVSLSLLVLFAAIVLLLYRSKRITVFRSLLVAERQSFAAAFILSFLCGILLTGFVRDPFSFDSINWDTVDGEVIFSFFTGHDNMFQYINGMAIVNNEPFSKYYDNGRLMSNVQDREVLGGVIYAVFRVLLSAVSQDIGQSYLTYTLVGLCMNIMAVFPIIVLLRRYFGRNRDIFFITTMSLNIFVLGNFYFTWFKFAGAALFVSGMTYLLRERKQLSAWLFAGAAFGLSSNMHAGNALGIPFLFLLIIFMNVRENGILSKSAVLFPLLLCMVFVLFNLPWAAVKSFYYPDYHTLFKFHYLPGSTLDQDLLAAAATFFKLHPLSEQLPYRLLNLCDSLCFSEILRIWHSFDKKNINKMLYCWTNAEFYYFGIAVYPMLTASLISRFVLRRHQAPSFALLDAAPRRQEFSAVLTASFLTIGILILLSYHNHPDLTYHLPMGVILMILTLLTGYSINSGTCSRLLLFIYGCLTAWRTASLFIYFH